MGYVVMADIADVETRDGERGEINWVRARAWLRGRGESEGSIEECGRRDFWRKRGLEGY